MNTAILIFTDPKSGTQEALSRLLNALGMADECRRAGDEVEIVFAGAGTRWPAELAKLSHPAHAFYDAVRDLVRGASCGCAHLNEATEGLEEAGIPLLADNAVAGTPGVVSIRRYFADGWHVAMF